MRREDTGPHGPVVRLFAACIVVLAAVKLVADTAVLASALPQSQRVYVLRDRADDHLSPRREDVARIRLKRQLPPIELGNQVIDDIFQIPITTLNAVGSLIKSTRPLVRRTRERIQQYYSGQQQQASAVSQYQQQLTSAVSQYQQQRPQYSYNNRPRPMPSSNFGSYNNRRKQTRDDPLPQGRDF